MFIIFFGGIKSIVGCVIGVYEELILWFIVIIIGNISGFYGLWYGFFVVNIVYLILFYIILLLLFYCCYVLGEIIVWLIVILCLYILKFV